MRIVGGVWRGRTIAAPAGSSTRPTTDRVREALFSAIAARLGNDMGGAHVLDAFAGSGALGLEALSRGAETAVFFENDRCALEALRANVAALDATSRSNVVAGDVFTQARRRARCPYALILLDPPYTLDQSCVAELLDELASVGAVETGALVTWEHATATEVAWPRGYRNEVRKSYGSTTVDFGVYEGGVGE